MREDHVRPSADPAVIELIRQAQAGSREAYLQLLGRYRPLLEASVARFVDVDMSMQDREDLREEAERVFLNALFSYDTEQEGVDFGLYAKICLRNGLISEWRSQTARRRVTLALRPEETRVDDSVDPAEVMEEEERFRALYFRIRDHLSELENRVWWMFVSGVEVKEIARRLQRDERSVHNAIYRIRQKLRRLLSDTQ